MLMQYGPFLYKPDKGYHTPHNTLPAISLSTLEVALVFCNKFLAVLVINVTRNILFETIQDILISTYKYNLDELVLNKLSYQVISNVDVFCPQTGKRTGIPI
jgi:hypothetical protein